MPDRRLIANAVLFQLSWLACVLGGNSYWLAVPAVALPPPPPRWRQRAARSL